MRNLAAFLKRSPDTASAEDLRRFQLDMVERGVSRTSLNATITGLRFFFAITLERPEVMRKMSHLREERRLPVVLSPEEMVSHTANAPSLKYRAAPSVAYGAGLRASEVVALRITDIDSNRMLLRVTSPPRCCTRSSDRSSIYHRRADRAGRWPGTRSRERSGKEAICT